MSVFSEPPHEDLCLNGIKMTVESLEFQSEVLQQIFPVLSACLSLRCVLAVTLCGSCLFGFGLCLCDSSVMKCHLSVKCGLINSILSKCVCICDTIESDSRAEVSHYKLSLHRQRSHFATVSPGWQGSRWCLQKYKSKSYFGFLLTFFRLQ